MIVRALQHVINGFFVDVGAYQPVVDSNTYALYQRGWRGVVAEPQQKLHPLWRQERPEDILVASAIGSAAGTTRFYEFAGRDQNATIDAGVAALHESEGRQASWTVIPQVPLTDILETYRPTGDIHLLSVDVEGAEGAVLAGLDMNRFRPWLLVLESTLPNRFQENFAAWEPLLLQQDYVFAYFDGVNRFYLAREHRELDCYFKHPPCVWDDFIDHRLYRAQETLIEIQQELSELKARRQPTIE